jgi:hypothetical protein
VASAAIRIARTTPTPSDSHSACAPILAAASLSPAPDALATCAVVPYWRKLKVAKTDRTVAAMPSAASWLRPRWPTMAVSART